MDPRGQRGDYLKVTITLPPEMISSLKQLGIERKLSGDKDFDVSSLIRESLENFLNCRLKFLKAVCFGKNRYYAKCKQSECIMKAMKKCSLTDWQLDILGESFDLDIHEEKQTKLYKNGRKVGFRMKKLD